ncbi:Ryncolin-1 [Lamellibrachia satsuma]|nr:Ryncolin-1 [Lamellibrachia satsuma]
MVTRLQDTVERLERQQQQHVDSMEKQEKQHQDSIEQLQKNTVERLERQNEQYVDSLEKQEKQRQDSIEQLQQQFNDSLEQQQEYVIKLEKMKENISTLEEDLRDLNKTCALTTSTIKPSPTATDCADLKGEGYLASGVYDIRLVASNKIIKVYCDMTTDGGGWLVFQRRQDGSVDFFRDWVSYKDGFGDVSGEFWLDFEGATRYAVYSSFAVADENHKYRLSLGAYSGTAGDSFTRHAGQAFSTKDRDNDAFGEHCAQIRKGAWWYRTCIYSNLNGQYLGGANTARAIGINWRHWHGYEYSLKKVEMKLRP